VFVLQADELRAKVLAELEHLGFDVNDGELRLPDGEKDF